MGLINMTLNFVINVSDTKVENISSFEQQKRKKLPSLAASVAQAIEEELTLEEEKREANKEWIKLIALIKNATSNHDEATEVIESWKCQKEEDVLHAKKLVKD